MVKFPKTCAQNLQHKFIINLSILLAKFSLINVGYDNFPLFVPTGHVPIESLVMLAHVQHVAVETLDVSSVTRHTQMLVIDFKLH